MKLLLNESDKSLELIIYKCSSRKTERKRSPSTVHVVVRMPKMDFLLSRIRL